MRVFSELGMRGTKVDVDIVFVILELYAGVEKDQGERRLNGKCRSSSAHCCEDGWKGEDQDRCSPEEMPTAGRGS